MPDPGATAEVERIDIGGWTAYVLDGRLHINDGTHGDTILSGSGGWRDEQRVRQFLAALGPAECSNLGNEEE